MQRLQKHVPPTPALGVTAHFTVTDADLPPCKLPARKRLGELRRSVVGADLDGSLERRLVGPLRAARRALRPPAPDVESARGGLGDFVAAVEEAAGPAGIRPEQAGAWIDIAGDVKRLVRLP